ncbi:MAG: amphi-Trp domain-containing protein [Chloroflexi bacterium]|nr:MAG: amphi-Trp domain-containing protein [Chloroflexota bacterium]MBL1194589.1 amphi-Trp domain-containing protein [Chloroflexota bacterium]NOH11878.1 amphi-Trp domain-containing protein [Chloroflexota bacterium]
MSKKEIVLMKSEQRLERSAVVAFLRELADKLDTGTITLTQAEDELQLEVPAQVVLEIKAEEETKSKGTQRSLEIEIEWMLGDGDPSKQAISLG